MIIDATTFIPLISACVHLFMFSYVFGQRQRSPVNYAFLVFSGGYFIVSLLEFVIYLPVSISFAGVLIRIAMSIMLLVTVADLYFVYAIVRGGRLDLPFKIISGAILAVAVLSIFICHTTIIIPMGNPSGRITPTMAYIPIFLLITASLFRSTQVLAEGWKAGSTFLIRQQCRLLFIGTLIAIVLSLLVLVIFPLILKTMMLFRFSSVSSLITMTMIYLAMQRYGLMIVDLETIRIVSDMLFRRINYGIVVTDRQGLIIQSNSLVREILELPDAGASFDTIRKALPGIDFNAPLTGHVVECATSSGPKTIEISHSDFSGSHPLLGGMTFFRDITEQRRLEEAFSQRLRLESLGRLAGGIAHDFNNQLTGIMGCADILRTELAEHQDALNLTEIIIGAAERSAKLTRQMLAFSRKGKFQNVAVDMCSIVTDVIAMLEHSIDKRIRIRRDFRADTGTVMGDPAQLHHTILNIALNGRDAMPEGGELGFSISTEVNGGDRRIRIVVSDNGVGIPLHLQSRIFEPFFTTKENGKGTGMGLAAAYGTVNAHHGSIKLESETGKGTRVIITLPVIETPSSKVSAAPPSATEPIPSHLRILIVEDEPSIAVMARETLRRAGCDTSVVENGRNAIAHYQEACGDIDVVLLDLLLPDMTGHQVFSALKAINPAVKVVLTSGYIADGGVQKILDEGALGFLQKPYQSAELIEKAQLACGVRN